MEQPKGYIVQVEGYDLRPLKGDQPATTFPFINRQSFSDLPTAFASAMTLPLTLFSKDQSAKEPKPFQLHRISFTREQDLRPLMIIQSSTPSFSLPVKELGRLKGIYLCTNRPSLVDQELKINLGELLYKPGQASNYLLAYMGEVGKHSTVIPSEGFSKLLLELQPHIQPLIIGPVGDRRQSAVRHLPTQRVVQPPLPSLKKTFGP